MESEELLQARSKLRKAKRLIRKRRSQDAKQLLEQISELEADLGPKEIVESAAEMLNQIEREHRLKFSRWVLIATVLVTSSVVAILTLQPIRSSPIELKLHVGRADFRPEKPISLEPITLTSVDFVGMTELKFKLADENKAVSSQALTGIPRDLKGPDAPGSSILRGTDPFSRIVLHSSFLRLSDLSAPEKAQVVFDTPEADTGLLKIIVSGRPCTGSIDIGKAFSVACQDCEIKEVRTPWRTVTQTPLRLASENKVVYFTGTTENGAVELNLQPAANEMQGDSLLLGRNFSIKSLELTRPQRDKQTVSSIVQPSQVVFVEFAKRKFVVSPGDFLKIGQLHEFYVKSVTLGRYLTIEAAGRIGEIEKISGNLRRNLMPSYLEWLLANYALNLFLAGLLPVLSVFLAAIYRLKILDEG